MLCGNCISAGVPTRKQNCIPGFKARQISLIDLTGHIKLTDFGLAVKLNQSELLYRDCGTCTYKAPGIFLVINFLDLTINSFMGHFYSEIIKNCGYNQLVDYWALGVVIFELVALKIPFTDNSKNNLEKSIINDLPKMELLEKITDDGDIYDLVVCLLQKEPEERLGGSETRWNTN